MKKLGLFLLLLLILTLSGFTIWAETPLGPQPEALAALQSNARVKVETKPWLVFRPSTGQPDTGLVFYPGGRVDPRSYAPAAAEIAAQGYLVVIVPMPLNLAVLRPGIAMDVINAFPEIQHWAVGGHSLGGAMAANFARKNPTQVEGLVFWAAYPASSDNLSSQPLAVVSIYGTLDGLSTGNKIDNSRSLLPASTRWVPVEGGNHAQFGWYGSQPGDRPSNISHQAQQQQTVDATLNLLALIKKSTTENYLRDRNQKWKEFHAAS